MIETNEQLNKTLEILTEANFADFEYPKYSSLITKVKELGYKPETVCDFVLKNVEEIKYAIYSQKNKCAIMLKINNPNKRIEIIQGIIDSTYKKGLSNEQNLLIVGAQIATESIDPLSRKDNSALSEIITRVWRAQNALDNVIILEQAEAAKDICVFVNKYIGMDASNRENINKILKNAVHNIVENITNNERIALTTRECLKQLGYVDLFIQENDIGILSKIVIIEYRASSLVIWAEKKQLPQEKGSYLDYACASLGGFIKDCLETL